MSTKKFISAALTATTSVWLSGAMLLVPTASAQTADALQAQIASLLAQIAQLQAQLGSNSGSAASVTFTKDLTLGSKGADVTALQNVLIAKGYLKIAAPTGYFGALTKAAVAAWQKASGISPAVGYFGPKSRAAMGAVAGGTGGTVPGVVVPGTGLAVSLAADSATGSAIAGAGQVKAGKFNFTAGSAGAVTITDLTFTKVGVLSDSNISNLYLADAMTGEIVAQYQSLTNGVATFSGLNLTVQAGQTWVGEFRMDLSSGASAGNTIAWQLTKVGTASNATVTGMPTTNALTVTTVSNPAIATVAISANAVGSSIDAGTSAALVSSWTANVGNSAVNLTNMQFQFVGSANPGDIKSLHLKVNGVDVATLPMASTNTNFNFASNPVKLGTGNATIELYADVMGSPNRNFTFSLLQPYRVGVVDTQYNTGVSPTITTTNQTTVNINPGSMTVSLSSNTPTGPVPNGASNVTLAKFRVYAAGEAVKVKNLDALITASGGTQSFSTSSKITNVKLVDDAGGQAGNTISTPGGAGGSGNGQCDVTANTLTCHFGTASSPMNYIVPANTSRELSLIVDIGSDNDRATLQGALVAMTNNLEGQVSYKAASSGAATGATRSVTTTPLAVVRNSAFSAPTYAAGANGVKIASFVISAGSADGARLTSLTFDKDTNANLDLQNLKVMVGSTQFGTTRATIADTETSLSFSGASPIQVAQGGSAVVDVYADVLTTSVATTSLAVIDLTGWSALGNISNSAITFPGAVDGQNIQISSGPQLTVAKDSNSAGTKQVVMGSTGNSLFTLNLKADNVEDIRVTDITLTDSITGSVSAGVASFQNLTLWNGTTQVAGPLSLSMAAAATGTATIAFNLSNGGVIVPKGGTTVALELKGDVATYSSGGAISGSVHSFGVAATSSVTALGKDSNTSAVVVGTPTSSAQTVYRTKLTLAGTMLGSGTNRVRTAGDKIATLNFRADAAGDATLNTVTLKFSGAAVASGTTAFSVELVKSDNTAFGSSVLQNCTPSTGNTCSVTFNPAYVITGGATGANADVRVNSASFNNVASTPDSLSLSVNANTDVQFSDGTSDVSLESTYSNFNLVTVSYE